MTAKKMIPDDVIARVRESTDLVELVREHVPALKKAGRNFQARCPFHQERTPSFSVNRDMGVFKCFGCGVGGDAFKFVMLTEGLTYPEAIRKLASRVGIQVEEARPELVSAESRERKALFEVIEGAARFYHRHLLESAEARPVREYLARRGLSPETIEQFQIGFAPSSGNALRDAAQRKGWSEAILEKAGLLRRKEGSATTFDHFWNRIIFPIWDLQGRGIAFGGRALGEAMPKYINSPETPIYSKSRHLYGLFQGLPALRKGRHAVILEGYMDVAVCHQYGFTMTSATLGTALTPEHVRLLRRYADNVTLLFDPDAAGAQATLRGGELLVSEGFAVRVVTLPEGLDPDEILIRDGKEKLEACLKESVSFLDYCVNRSLGRNSSTTPEGKLEISKDILPLIQKVRDPLLQDEYLSRLADALNVDRGVLGRQLKTLKTKADRKDVAAAPANAAEKSGPLQSVEEEILLLALLYPSAEVAESVAGFPWRDARCQQAWDVLGTDVAGGTLHLPEALPKLPQDLQDWLTPLAMEQREYRDPSEMLRRFIESWQRQRETVEMARLRSEIDSMLEGRIPKDAQKIESYNDLARRLKGTPKNNEREATIHGRNANT
jgi:DNA primase